MTTEELRDCDEHVHHGACFCGKVKVEARGEPVLMGYCHCTSCRTYAGAPVSAFTLWPADRVQVVSGVEYLASYNKRGFSERRYCGICGGHVLVNHPTLGMVDAHASTLPDVAFRPVVHLNYQETVLPLKDGLPKLKDLPADIGGSGEEILE